MSLCLKLILKCEPVGLGIFNKAYRNIKWIPALWFLSATYGTEKPESFDGIL